MTSLAVQARPDFTDVGEISEFCSDMLRHLARSDQRHWGEIYVRGLVCVPGRKSIRRMSDYIVGARADQGIQQFVNQSPWDWAPVRRNLAHYVPSLYRPEAWVVEEMVTAKNGSSSVGVARQYAHSAGRVMNCQVGLGVFLTGSAFSTPVNWRLLLPREWDTDTVRRGRTHLPEHERYKTRWRYLIDAIDEMTLDWELDRLPIVLDAQHDTNVEPLLRALEERGHHYLARVAPGTPTAPVTLPGRGPAVTCGDNAEWPATMSRFIARSLPRQTEPDAARWCPKARLLLAEWLPGRLRPAGLWLTNLNTVRMPDLIGLTRARRTAAAEMTRLCDEFGLGHFEGRSFRGWHHHVTLVSLAHAYTMSRRRSRTPIG
jgi:SRSO17 transposase